VVIGIATGNGGVRDMSTALKGVRIIDLTREMVGSLGTALLGDLGAEVLRVEGMNNDTGHKQDLAEVRYSAKWNYWFDFIHRNKKNIGVNLKSEGGTEVIAKLAETSDVFATDMPEQILREMGTDYQSLSKINPRLVYADTPSPAGA
jgi:formyl-CoA transferase